MAARAGCSRPPFVDAEGESAMPLTIDDLVPIFDETITNESGIRSEGPRADIFESAP